METHPTSALLITPLVTRTLLIGLGIVIVVKGLVFAGFIPIQDSGLTDFEVFHLVGRMVWRGEIADAYHFAAMVRAQEALVGRTGFLPWTYPPPFALVVALLARAPIGISYGLFTGTTLLAFLLVLRRLAGPGFPVVLVALYPVLLVTAGCGQNGFLTGTLVGLTVLGLRADRTIAGIPLGLMAIKPHLAVAIALFTLLTRRWAVIGLAVATAAALTAVSTVGLGPAVWPAFLNAIREAGGFLAGGLYPMHRMISVYALLRSLGAPASIAMSAQVVVALTGLGLVTVAALRRATIDRQLGIAALASLCVSPYAYDYDLPIYGVALALLMPDVARRATKAEQWALVGLGIAAGTAGLVTSQWIEATLSHQALAGGVRPGIDATAVSITPALLLAADILIGRILLRHDPKTASDGPASATKLPIMEFALAHAERNVARRVVSLSRSAATDGADD